MTLAESAQEEAPAMSCSDEQQSASEDGHAAALDGLASAEASEVAADARGASVDGDGVADAEMDEGQASSPEPIDPLHRPVPSDGVAAPRTEAPTTEAAARRLLFGA